MKKAIDYYNEVAKKFNVTKEKSLHPRQKLAYVSEQANQQRAIINRLLVDCALTMCELDGAKDPMTQAAYTKKLNGYEDDLRQLSKSLDVAIELEKDLQSESPELTTTEADYPEGA